MQIIRPDINIDFVGRRKIAFFFSSLLIALTIFTLIIRKGPNLGVDFTGGIVIHIKMKQEFSPAEIRKTLSPIGLEDSIVQEFEERGSHEYLIRVRKKGIGLSGLDDKVKDILEDRFGKVEIRRIEMVGPKVGKDLREKALLAIFYAILFMAIYISGRFELKWTISAIMALALAVVVYIASLMGVGLSWLIIIALIVTLLLCWFLKLRYALGAIVALIHDVTITLGVFAFTNKEISLSIIAAFLTIVGYSLNDTIVVFDRIRENIKRLRKAPFTQIMNRSINETLSRTILTSGTTLLVVFVLVILGGGVIHDFAFAILIGIIVGTYSSIYIASPVLLLWEDSSGKRSKASRSAK